MREVGDRAFATSIKITELDDQSQNQFGYSVFRTAER